MDIAVTIALIIGAVIIIGIAIWAIVAVFAARQFHKAVDTFSRPDLPTYRRDWSGK